MACDPTLDRMSLKVRFRGQALWVSDAKCRPAHPGCLSDRVLASHAVAFPKSGVFIRHRGGEREVADPNHVLFFNPDEPYRSSHPGGLGDDCDVITIRADALARLVRRWDPGADERTTRLFALGCHATSPRIALIQRLMSEALARPGVDAEEAEEAILTLVGRVLEEAYRARVVRSAFVPVTTKQHLDWVECVKSMLASEFRRGPSLADVSDAAGCSPFHLCRVFKKHTGLSIHRYLNRIRLRTALEHVLDPQAHLADLADSLGYSSHSHFTDAFRREFGVTPTLARRALGAVSLRNLAALLDPAEPLGPALVRLTAPAPQPVAEPENDPPVPPAADDDPYAFRGEALDPCPYALPRVPLQPHAA